MPYDSGAGRRRLGALAVGVLGAAAAAGSVVMYVQRGPGAPPLPPPSAAARPASPPPVPALPASTPLRLEVPRIGVRTPLMPLAKNPDRTVQVPPPDRADEAGWYRLGPSPGARGPAVIIGHVDSRRGPAVFYRLGELRPGDIARVYRGDGRTAVFVIDSVERVGKDAFPTQRVYGALSYPGLRLITCGGRFDRATGHYIDNVIAYGHLS